MTCRNHPSCHLSTIRKFLRPKNSLIAVKIVVRNFCQLHLLQPISHSSPLANHKPTHNHIAPLVSVCYITGHTLSLVLYAVNKGLRGRNVLHQLLLILLYMYLLTISLPDINNVATSLYNINYVRFSAILL